MLAEHAAQGRHALPRQQATGLDGAAVVVGQLLVFGQRGDALRAVSLRNTGKQGPNNRYIFDSYSRMKRGR